MSAALPLLQGLAGSAEGLARGGYLLVQDGDAFTEPPATVPLATGASARVVKADSELALRHALWKHPGAPLVALVPEGLDLPADLLLGAERRRVHTLTGDEVLSAVLRTRVVGIDDAELRALALEHADQIQARLEARTTPTVIDRALLERTLVEVVAELQDLRDAQGGLARLLASWIRRPPAWTPAVRRLAASTLAENHGEDGRALAWVLDDPATRAPGVLVHGALLSVDARQAVPPAAWGPLAPLADAEDSPLRMHKLARALVVQLAEGAAAALGHAVRPLLAEADTLARQMLPPSLLRTSKLLPLAFEEQAHAVATRLSRGETVAPEQMARLRTHAFAHTEDLRLALLDDMARLVRYLQQPRPEAQGGPALAAAYLSDHAWADWVARRVQRALSSAPAHHDEARALLQRVVEARDALNRSFAGALADHYEATLYSRDHGVIALHKLTGDVVAERRCEPGCDRVFLLVLDGCSVPVFLDLLHQLTSPDKSHKVGLESADGMALRLQPGLAPLPTITSHARGSLFLGSIPSDPFQAETVWRADGERVTDPARFKQNPLLGGATRKLFLKGDLADGGAALRDALLGDLDVVAAVFNAVDDRIGSHDTGAAWRMQVEDITGLVPALHAALDSGRKVLLTADHGHSPFQSKDLRVGAGSTPRFVPLEGDEQPPEGFVEIDCGDLAGREGRLAFAWQSGVYRGQVQVGFHGGASLEEVVVPVAWLARDGQPADRPAWWAESSAGQRVHAAPVSSPQQRWAPRPAPAVAPRPAPRSAPAPAPTPAAAPVAAPVAAPEPGPAPRPVSPAPSLVAAPGDAPRTSLPTALRGLLRPKEEQAVLLLMREGKLRTSDLSRRVGGTDFRMQAMLSKVGQKLAGTGARVVGEPLPDGELQWRYEGPPEAT